MKHQQATVTVETRLAYTNAFGEEMALTMSPETHQSDYDWRAANPSYKNVRWERRVVTVITTDWEPLAEQMQIDPSEFSPEMRRLRREAKDSLGTMIAHCEQHPVRSRNHEWANRGEHNQYDSLVARGRRLYDGLRTQFDLSHDRAFDAAKRQHGLKDDRY